MGITAQVIVTDITRRIIMQASATDGYEVDLEGFAAGIYFIKVAKRKISSYLKAPEKVSFKEFS